MFGLFAKHAQKFYCFTYRHRYDPASLAFEAIETIIYGNYQSSQSFRSSRNFLKRLGRSGRSYGKQVNNKSTGSFQFSHASVLASMCTAIQPSGCTQRKPRRVFRLPTSHFRLPTSNFQYTGNAFLKGRSLCRHKTQKM